MRRCARVPLCSAVLRHDPLSGVALGCFPLRCVQLSDVFTRYQQRVEIAMAAYKPVCWPSLLFLVVGRHRAMLDQLQLVGMAENVGGSR